MNQVVSSIVADSLELHDDCQGDSLNLRILQTFTEGFLMAWRMNNYVDKDSYIELTMKPHPVQPDLFSVYVEVSQGPSTGSKGIACIDHPLVPFSERPEACEPLDVTGAADERSEAWGGHSVGDEAPTDHRPADGGKPSPEASPGKPPDPPPHRPRF